MVGRAYRWLAEVHQRWGEYGNTLTLLLRSLLIYPCPSALREAGEQACLYSYPEALWAEYEALLGEEAAVEGWMRAHEGYFLAYEGALGAAWETLEGLLREAPDTPLAGAFWAKLGEIAKREGDPARAMECYEQALVRAEGLGDEFAVVRLHLGYLYQQLGRVEEARAQFDRILERSPLERPAVGAAVELANLHRAVGFGAPSGQRGGAVGGAGMAGPADRGGAGEGSGGSPGGGTGVEKCARRGNDWPLWARSLRAVDEWLALSSLEDWGLALVRYCYIGGQCEQAVGLARGVLAVGLEDRYMAGELKGLNPSWSPNGKQIACVAIREKIGIYLIKPDGSEPRWIESLARETEPFSRSIPWWSPDGRKLAVAQASVQRVRANLQHKRPGPSSPTGRLGRSVSWR